MLEPMNLSSLISQVPDTLFTKIAINKNFSFVGSIALLLLLLPSLIHSQISATEIQEKIEASEALRLNGQLPDAIE